METPLDQEKMIKQPMLSERKGGLKTMPFIITNEALEKVASYGLMPNMVLYLTRDYGMGTSEAATVTLYWSAASNFTPILGAFLADSYVGRYWMIGFGSIASLLGAVLLWLTAMIPQARPPPCSQFSSSCESATPAQLVLLYTSLATLAVGAGGIRSCSLAFGADQLMMGTTTTTTQDNLKDVGGLRESYFNWYYVSVSVAVTLALTCIVYIQEAMGWNVGFGVAALLMLLSALSFFIASPLYVKLKADASFLTEFAQVLKASFANRNIRLPPQQATSLLAYQYHHREGSTLLVPSENLRFLNKACLIRDPQEDLMPDGRASDPWRLCTVDQVEDLKSVIKIIPIWSAGMMAAVTVCQGSFITLQVSTMDRHITSNFQIPTGSFAAFIVLTVAAWVPLYDRILIPLASKIKGKPTHLSLKQRMGIGVLISSASMAALAIVESVRRNLAIQQGFQDDPKAIINMSAMWILWGIVLSGLTESFNAIGQYEFYYTELPKSIPSIATTLYSVGLSAANLLASFIVNVVDDSTKAGGEESWISSNINKGHYDYYYWLLAAVSLANFAYYIVCCKMYGHCKGDVATGLDGEETS